MPISRKQVTSLDSTLVGFFSQTTNLNAQTLSQLFKATIVFIALLLSFLVAGRLVRAPR